MKREELAKIKKGLTNVRVLQHDLQDEIRIGVAFPIWNTPEGKDNVVLKTIETYDEKLKWCGGYEAGVKKHFKRIALVNADTLEVIRLIYYNELKAPVKSS